MQLISIIVPVYNGEKYLNRCLKSICTQTYRDLEIVIVDDGSQDNSRIICEDWAKHDERIRVFSQKNSGVSSARNKALEIARGDLIMFVDCDDYMFPEMCFTMFSKLEKSNADCVVCGTKESFDGLWASDRDVDYQSLPEFKSDFPYWVKTELFAPPWNKIYRRELIKELFPENLSFGEDLIFNLNYLNSCSRISVIKDVPYFHEKENEQSLVNKVYPNRLLEIEKIHCALSSFVGAPCKQVDDKGLREVSVYLLALIKSNNYSEWRNRIKLWAKSSFINRVDIFRSAISFKQKILLVLVRMRAWWIIDKVLIK